MSHGGSPSRLGTPPGNGDVGSISAYAVNPDGARGDDYAAVPVVPPGDVARAVEVVNLQPVQVMTDDIDAAVYDHAVKISNPSPVIIKRVETSYCHHRWELVG